VLGRYDKAIIALIAALASNDTYAYEQALLELALVLALDPQLVEYHRYRDYAPGNIPDQHLRELDQNQTPDGDDDDDDEPPPEDGDQVDDLTGGAGGGGRLENIGLGPNFVIGRRTWIDVQQ
jgi:tetratricopeptide (TPR) repeat protein